MPNINIAVRKKIAKNVDETEYICGNSDFLIDFDFDAEWDAYETKTARFIYGTAYQDIVFQGNQCKVPVMSNTNTILCGVFAGDLHTTTPALIKAQKSILCGNGIPAAPSEDVYAQIMELIQGMNDPEAIAKAVAEYMAQNPITESDPTVPEWAKAEKKPEYTAKEVGAVGAEELPEAINTALAQAKESGEFEGAPGKDGEDGQDGYTPIKGVDYFDGADGKNGQDGKDGGSVYILDIEKFADKSVILFYEEASGRTLDVSVKNGAKGNDGYTPVKGKDYFDGSDGKDGQNGQDGYTPVKGTDYWTATDKAEMVNDVLSALPTWTGGSY